MEGSRARLTVVLAGVHTAAAMAAFAESAPPLTARPALELAAKIDALADESTARSAPAPRPRCGARSMTTSTPWPPTSSRSSPARHSRAVR
jgi:hypothetical protein